MCDVPTLRLRENVSMVCYGEGGMGRTQPILGLGIDQPRRGFRDLHSLPIGQRNDSQEAGGRKGRTNRQMGDGRP
jgi:hypothetical protein